MADKILITGGAGFVGSRLAFAYREKYPKAKIVAIDNLKRRGSEINLQAFKERGIQFLHGDIRSSDDVGEAGAGFDLFIEASAEPSVLAGTNGSSAYLIQTNLFGTVNCLEFARKNAGQFVFLSTSRVYSIEDLRTIPTRETESRFEIDVTGRSVAGLSSRGISEGFATHRARSLYGATKLASELLIQEYAQTYKLNAVINRCGVIAGAGQFGKVDQGVFTLWIMRHHFKKSLKYTGFGGTGKQVRDLLHPLDLFDAIESERSNSSIWNGEVFNLGGGREVSVSMKELTEMARNVTGQKVEIASDPQSHSVDIPLYVTDYEKAKKTIQFKPKRGCLEIFEEIENWIRSNEKWLERTLLTE